MIAVALLAFCWFGQFVSLSAREAPQLKVDEAPLPSDGRPFTFAPIIKKVSPSVVNVYTAKTIREASPLSPLFDDPFLRQFFGVGVGKPFPASGASRVLAPG